MKLTFNQLGVLTDIVYDSAYRQGSVGTTVTAKFTNRANYDYVAKLNITRPDDTVLTDLIMLPSSTNTDEFSLVFNDEWFFAVYGTATLTVYLYDGGGNVLAQGQVQFEIEQTDYSDNPPSITTEQYNTLLAAMTNKLNKYTGDYGIYATDDQGEQTILNYSNDHQNGDTVVMRKSNGQLDVPATPSSDNDAASKKYVDDLSTNNRTYIDTKLSDKQDKLIAGAGITISSNNVISSSAGGVSYEFVDELPESGQLGVFYLVPSQDAQSDNAYNEYIWVVPEGEEGHFELIGTTDISTDDFYTKAESDAKYVDLTSAQTITGAKTFTEGVKFSTATTNWRIWQKPNGYFAMNADVERYVYGFYTFYPGRNNETDLGSSSYKWKNIYFAGYLSDGNNTNYGLTLPDTTSFTANSELVDTASDQTITGVKTTEQFDFKNPSSLYSYRILASANNVWYFYSPTSASGIGFTPSKKILPYGDNSHDLGDTSMRWKDLYLSDGIYGNQGRKDIDLSGGGISLGGELYTGLIRPRSSGNSDIGSSIMKYRDLYLSGTAYVNQILGKDSQGYWSTNSIRPISTGINLGGSNNKFNAVFTNYVNVYTGLGNGTNANYRLTLPDMTSWTANKTIATTDQLFNVVVSTIAELTQAFNDGNKTIMFKDGTDLTVSSTITIPAGTTILGNGAIIRRATGFEGHLITIGAGGSISNLTIYGNRTNMVSPTWDTTQDLSLSGNNTVEDITIIDGNEGIVSYGNRNVIKHCSLTNMGGNGIHFSGSDYTVVEGCYINGANKRSGMGHEDGCIVWSNECRYIVCENNYCEDGKTGFGSIDTFDNSYAKVINNTIKNCINSFDLQTASSPSVDVLIDGNLIINSGNMIITKSALSITAQARYTISNNTLINSSIKLARFDTINILNNIILDGWLEHRYCSNLKIIGNTIKNYSTNDACVSGDSINVIISNNYLRGQYYVINNWDTHQVIVSNNLIRAYDTDNTKWAINHIEHFVDNQVVSYNNGLQVDTNDTCNSNYVILKDTSNYSLREYGGTTNAMCCLNRVNGTTNFTSNTSNQNIGNITTASNTSYFTDVVNTLTNITTSGYNTVITGDDYVATLTADTGYTLPDTITVEIGSQTTGENEYIYDKTTGRLIVFGVSGELTITASGVAE